ncbi:alpha/beta fold hydrolase [Microbulbifer aggregans]|uniref:alpha/beta fold hydrolase n=1 Tax=Microbulbifer aggregans TaxID=1769779 RepID=UPI001CFECE67|nr:alpha/beta fold hydrolase [Microbulbifer aggregans]
MSTDNIKSTPSQRHHFEHRGFQLAYNDTHPDDASRPVALLMHGFPDTADLWQQQIKDLTAAGYRCIAPDTLGCGQSDIAENVGDYNVLKIISDHIALLDLLTIARVDVIGHDWGAVQAWLIAAHYPERVRTLTAVSVGHPGAYARAGFRQWLAGWYIGYFQLKGISERLLLGSGRFSLRNVFRTHPSPDEVMERLAKPGRLTAALRIYRANLVTVLARPHPKVKVPTMSIWSDGDLFLIEKQVTSSEKWVDNSWQYHRVSGAHWVPITAAQTFNEKLLQHLQAANARRNSVSSVSV